MTRTDEPHKRPNELLQDLYDHIASALGDSPLDAETASALAYTIVDRMCSHWGGQNIYFPQGASFRRPRKDAQIWAEFDGSNHAELARRYQCSVQWIYRVIQRKRADTAARHAPAQMERYRAK